MAASVALGHLQPESHMRATRRRLAAFACAWLPVLLSVALEPAVVSAQTAPQRSWAIVPLLGFGVVRNGGWGSAGMEAAIELEYGGTGWRWSGYASQRGVGVGCSHACFDGGPAVAVGGSRSVGAVWIGGGAGVMKQLGEWRLLPYGRISLDLPPFRFDLRVELPQWNGSGPYLPILMGIPITR